MNYFPEYILTAIDYYRPGGIVMVLILVVSLWMWVLIIDRILFFSNANKRDLGVKEAVALLKKNSKGLTGSGSCINMMKGFLQERTGDPLLDKKILEQYAIKEEKALKSSLQLITVLAATAPMMGLLGTVTGMVSTFDVIALFGTGNARALSGGISEALITTQSGLLAGIPGLFMSRLLKYKSEKMSRRFKIMVMALTRNL
ncbi:MAG: MotA/TolQ/ExbB proton channel family protein [Deltaproteobacteria bacterium]|nr:MotA/TolQ/ExbB proton channel family protein [Deltaproteobacteria bacterium]